MAGLRPGRCYRRVKRPYTRQSMRVPRKSYVKGVPKPKIAQFEMGKLGKYDKKVFLVSGTNVQIRHNALEAARVITVQTLDKGIGKGGDYFVKIRIYPHHVLRENALATGAGADRFQQGMRQSFGKPVGTAAQVKKGQKIIEVRVDGKNEKLGRLALKKASYKMPTKCDVIVE
ncbi:50S ribosomal protein L16 [Candidatus Aenigmatarchaeota archaeon]